MKLFKKFFFFYFWYIYILLLPFVSLSKHEVWMTQFFMCVLSEYVVKKDFEWNFYFFFGISRSNTEHEHKSFVEEKQIKSDGLRVWMMVRGKVNLNFLKYFLMKNHQKSIKMCIDWLFNSKLIKAARYRFHFDNYSNEIATLMFLLTFDYHTII